MAIAREAPNIDFLEAMVDRCGLANVLDGLARVCELKAEQIECNWQDKRTADLWSQAGRSVARSADGMYARLISQ